MNIIGRRPRGGWPRYANTHVQAFEGLGWPICWAPALVDLMNLMHELKVISFRWLTTWEHDGPRDFAPAIGLSIGDWVAAEDRGTSQTWWKLDAIVDHLGESDELFIWTDDDIGEYLQARQVVDMLSPERAVVVHVDGKRGLSPQDFNVILTAIEQLR